MGEKVKYKRTVVLDKSIADKIESLNLKGLQRNQALKFIRLLVKNSKQINDDNDSYNEVELPNTYLKKTLGGNYNVILNILVENGVIIRNDKYSTISHKCKKYSINKSLLLDDITIIDSYYNINDININTNMSTMCTRFLPDTKVELVYSEVLSSETAEFTSNYRENAPLLKTPVPRMQQTSLNYAFSISISDFKVNEQIEEKSICFGDPSEKSSWRKRDKILKEIEGTNKKLIKDGKKYFIMTEEEFINRKRRNVLESHFNIIHKIGTGEYFASRNTTNNRLDTNFTSMPSYLFNEIKKENDLIELDLCNSQMAIFTLVCDLKTKDYEEFKYLSLNCSIYEHVAQELGLKGRDDGKSVCFSVLFSHYQNPSPHLKRFKSLFPSVMEWINNYKKEHGSKNFSIMLQKKEAEIFIDNVYQRVINEKLLVFSKHDSIICRKSDEKTVRKIMEDYFQEINFQVVIR